MRKLLLSAALAASTLVAITPAAAQYRYPNRQYGYGQQYGASYLQRIDRLHQRIHLLDRRGAFSRNEAYRLNREVDQLAALYNRYRYNGITEREAYDLDRRLAGLREQVREDRFDGRSYERHDHDRRYDDYDRRGRDSRWDRDDRRDRWDD